MLSGTLFAVGLIGVIIRRNMITVLMAIPLLPALGALLNGVRAFAKPLTPKNRAITNLIALGSPGLSALLAAWTVITYVGGGTERAFERSYYTWIPAGVGHVGKSLAD